MATLILTFMGQTKEEATIRVIWLFIGLFIIYLFTRSTVIDKGMRWLIKRALERLTSLRIYDYEQLLGLSKGYSIGEFKVRKGSWLENKKLRDLKLDEEGVVVLAIYRKIKDKEKYIGVPDGDTEIMRGDILICYGLGETIKNLSQRLKGIEGDKQHEQAVEEERVRKEKER